MAAMQGMNRRLFLRSLGLGATAALLAACTPAAPAAQPTTAPAKPTEAPKPTTPPTTAPAPAATTAPAAAAASPSAAPTTAPAAKVADLGKIKVLNGTAPPDPTSHFFNYALENGFYKEVGLDVEIQPFNGDVTALRALVAGEGDVAWTAFHPGVTAIQAGSKLKNISATAPRLDYLLVAQKEVADVKSLEGKSVAVSQPGAVSYQAPRLMIEAAGGDPNKVDWLTVGGSSARVQALLAKKADAAALNASFATRARKSDFLHEIGDAAKALPNYIYGWELATEDALSKRRPAFEAFVLATLKGARWGMQQSDKAAEISKKILPDVPAEELEAGVKAFGEKQYWNVNGTLPREAWDFTMADMLKSGELKQPLNYSDIVVVELSQAAAAKLGPYTR